MLLNLVSLETPPISGSGSTSFAGAAMAGAGALEFAGAGGAALAVGAAAGGAAQAFTGTGDQTFAGSGASGTGALTFAGSDSTSLAVAASSGSGQVSFTGSALAAQAVGSTAGTGLLGFAGSATSVTAPPALDEAGQESFAATAAQTSAPPAVAQTGQQTFSGGTLTAFAAAAGNGIGTTGQAGAPDPVFGSVDATLSTATVAAEGEEVAPAEPSPHGGWYPSSFIQVPAHVPPVGGRGRTRFRGPRARGGGSVTPKPEAAMDAGVEEWVDDEELVLVAGI